MITIARLTLVEAARRRLLWVLLVLTVTSVGVTAWGAGRLVAIVQQRGEGGPLLAVGVSQVLILAAFMFSFILAMTAAFLAAPAIAGEIESGIAQAVLARPIRRADIVLGKWLGLSAVTAGYAVGASLLEIVAVAAVTGYGPPDPLGAAAFVAAEAIILLTFALLLSTRLPAIAGGAISVVAFGLAWMMGVLGGVGAFFGVDVLARAAGAVRVLFPTDMLWRGVVFSLEPPVLLALLAGRQDRMLAANPFYAAAPPSLPEIAWVCAWLALALGLAIVSFRRREV